MLWHSDTEGGQWAATVSPQGNVRLLRQMARPPYHESGEPRLEYQTVEIDPLLAQELGRSLVKAGDAGFPILLGYKEATGADQ